MQPLVSWKIGGDQGEGIDSTGDILATVVNRLGYHVYGYKHFSSRIRGGHTNYKIRIATEPVLSTSDDLQILVALNQESIDRNWRELVEGGLILADSHFNPTLPEGCNATLLSMPLTEIAQEVGNAVMKNIVSLGASSYLLGTPLNAFQDVVFEKFGRKSEKLAAMNRQALEKGYAYASEHFPEAGAWRLAPGDGRPRLLMTGNEAVALGALAAGCRVMTGYPITPASEIMQWLMEKFQKFGGVAVQTEDELAAITAALGAGYAGARAMTATSGPGLSLMMEALGLASTTETPVVIVDVQRAGPSTGMPTKMEQSDLYATVYGGHGDAPRIVLAPSTAEEAFYDAAEAFNLAEEYQTPVIIASDLALGLFKQTVDSLDYSRIEIRRGKLVSDEELKSLGPGVFKRYHLVEDGISPRSLPGQPNGQFLATGVEHNEFGKVTEDPDLRKAMVDKRWKKLENLPLRGVKYHGPENPDLLLVGWGSTIGALRYVQRDLMNEGVSVGHLHVRVLSPFPAEEINEYLAGARQVLVVEQNYAGQLANEMALRTAVGEKLNRLTKYNGVPFLPSEIYAKAHEVLGSEVLG